ncbi:hypothetical protein FHS68_003998 [Dyadobacter arcticus]|uniref:Uncharacterized protein n=1 Tax=Dyadobacter arcticus TaxID=1078754 RepID=A0ABX0UP93_9BACT|nr:hypothetical protein [Dyadobacter arcticus]
MRNFVGMLFNESYLQYVCRGGNVAEMWNNFEWDENLPQRLKEDFPCLLP